MAAGLLADAVHADVVRVRAAGGAVDHLILEQVVGARLLHAAVQAASILDADCRRGEKTNLSKNETRKKEKSPPFYRSIFLLVIYTSFTGGSTQKPNQRFVRSV